MKRSLFSGKLGFVLSAAGSAVGLGNIWRFPYLAVKHGGGIFLLVYIILSVTFGFSMMCAEVAIGRKTGLSVIGAYKKLSGKFSFLGKIASVVPMIIFPYYCVIGGWVIKYLYSFLTGGVVQAAENGYFAEFTGDTLSPVFWMAIFMAISSGAVMMGVEKGVEKLSKFLMPVLVILSIIIAVYVITLPNAMDGLLFYITPDFSRFSLSTVLAAMGQLFYSMSIAMGILVTYGSYMKKDIDIEKSTVQVEIFDTGIAFISGLMIVPAVFIFSGGNTADMNAGAGLMFVTLPKVFTSMSWGGFIGTVFFVLVFLAALTSAVSIMETVVSIICDRYNIGRKKASACVFAFSFVLALISCFGYSIWSDFNVFGMSFLDLFDFLSNTLLMPTVAFLTCILIGRVTGVDVLCDEIKQSSKFKREKLFRLMIKYISPVFIVLILLSSLLDVLGIIKM